jgi:hypothetical protein
MGDHIVIEALIEEGILRNRSTELYDAEDAAILLTLKLRGQMEHRPESLNFHPYG